MKFPRMRLAVSAAAVAAVLGGLSLVQAQGAGQSGQAARPKATTAPKRGWYSINMVTVKSDSLNEFIDFQKSQTIPMLQRGGVKVRDTWQGGAPFGDSNTFVFVTAIDKFADYDLEPRVLRVLGADAGRAYQEKNRRMVASSHTFAMQDRVELSIQPSTTFKPKAGILTLTTVVSGHADDYEAFIKNDLLPVYKRGKVGGYLVSKTIFGGDANEYGAMQLIDSYAEIDKGPLTVRVLGQAAAQQLTAKATPHIASQRRELVRYNSDLSFRVPSTTQAR